MNTAFALLLKNWFKPLVNYSELTESDVDAMVAWFEERPRDKGKPHDALSWRIAVNQAVWDGAVPLEKMLADSPGAEIDCWYSVAHPMDPDLIHTAVQSHLDRHSGSVGD